MELDERSSDEQEAWRDIALRLRMLLDDSVAMYESVKIDAEKAGKMAALPPEAMQNLATAALSAFALARQAASYDSLVRRDSGGW